MILTDGWIKIHRKLLKWEWYKNSQMVHVFLTLLIMAEIGNDGETEYGQLRTSVSEIADATWLNKSVVRRCLMKLRESKCISIEATRGRKQLITIVNYGDYQGGERKPTSAPTPIPNESDGFFESMKNSQIWKESIMMKFHLSSEDVDKKIDEFALDCKCNSKTHLTETDARRHFVNWMNKLNEITQQNDRQNKYDRRRAAEVKTPTTADDWDAPF